uniref:Uncharacterized protein n=1 Tax=Caenorhabditis japonica TaxID=281687 RepID=A0A8R1EHA7_CAEJA
MTPSHTKFLNHHFHRFAIIGSDSLLDLLSEFT